MELVADSALRPAITEHALIDAKKALGPRNKEAVADPIFMASEGVVAAAYQGALARPVLWTGAPISPELLADFHAHVRSRPSLAEGSSSCFAVMHLRRWNSHRVARAAGALTGDADLG